MEKVIDFCGKQNNFEQKIFVLADMKELGETSAAAHSQIGKAVAKTDASLVILTGPEMKAACSLLSKEKEIAGREVKENALILFKGSHSMALEKLLPLIEEGSSNKKSGGAE